MQTGTKNVIAAPVMVKVYLKAFPSFAMNIYCVGVLGILISLKGILYDGKRKKQMRTSTVAEKYLRYRDSRIYFQDQVMMNYQPIDLNPENNVKEQLNRNIHIKTKYFNKQNIFLQLVLCIQLHIYFYMF